MQRFVRDGEDAFCLDHVTGYTIKVGKTTVYLVDERVLVYVGESADVVGRFLQMFTANLSDRK